MHRKVVQKRTLFSLSIFPKKILFVDTILHLADCMNSDSSACLAGHRWRGEFIFTPLFRESRSSVIVMLALYEKSTTWHFKATPPFVPNITPCMEKLQSGCSAHSVLSQKAATASCLQLCFPWRHSFTFTFQYSGGFQVNMLQPSYRKLVLRTARSLEGLKSLRVASRRSRALRPVIFLTYQWNTAMCRRAAVVRLAIARFMSPRLQYGFW